MKPASSLIPDSIGPREILFGIAIFILILPYFGLFGGAVEMEVGEINNAVTEYGVTEAEISSDSLEISDSDLEVAPEDQADLDDVNELLEKARRARGQDK